MGLVGRMNSHISPLTTLLFGDRPLHSFIHVITLLLFVLRTQAGERKGDTIHVESVSDYNTWLSCIERQINPERYRSQAAYVSCGVVCARMCLSLYSCSVHC